MISNETKFRPVYGRTEEAILAAPITPGYFYVASDTGRLFVDVDINKRISAGGGGGISIYYSVQNEVAQDGNDYYIILKDSVTAEGVSLKEDDLIINSDGAFYRVYGINEDENYMCLQIAISGTGGGGGGGGGGPISQADVRFTFDNTAIGNNKTYVYDKDYYVEFYPVSDVDQDVELAFLITQNGQQYEAFSETVDSGGVYKFNTGRLPKGEGITIQVQASSVNSTMASGPKRTFANITTRELGISKDNSFNACTIQEGECALGFVPVSNGMVQTLHVLIDGEELDLNSGVNKNLLSFTPTGNAYTVRIPAQSHGVHQITLYMSITISGVQLDSDTITYELAWKDDQDNSPILWIGNYDTKVINYNEAIIPFMVYNPDTEKFGQKTKVYLVANGVEIPTSPMEVQYDGNNWIQWDVTNLYEANNTPEGKANLFTITCGSTTKRVTIHVTTEGSRDLGLVNENALILNLVATGRSNSETSVSRSTWAFDRFNTTFNNFNWYNNGWLNDNDGNGSYLSVANGASAVVNLRSIALNTTYDYSFEIRFRVRNIQEYSTLIRTIPKYYVNENNNSWTVEEIRDNEFTYKKDEDGNTIMDKSSPKQISSTAGVIFKYLNSSGYGFCIGTQEAYFRTPGSIANVRYKEDEIINISFVVSNTNKLMSIYLNGILSGALALDNTAFTMDNDKYEITSEFCDIDIYKLRIYQTELTMPDVIHNYIADIHDIDLYDQNQLTDTSDGTILWYHKLIEFNENVHKHNQNVRNATEKKEYSMPYAVWELIDNGTGINDPNKGTHAESDDKLPFFKGNNRYCKITFVNPAADAALEEGALTEEQYYNSSPSFVCIGADINVQGTSSQAYPRRNMKTKMKPAVKGTDAEKITHEDWGWFYTKGSKAGEKFKEWNMDNANCATDKFTWKIDYMESSGTYNTGFANLVGNNMYDYHPLSTIPGMNLTGQGYRTSVYGFPVMVFHKHSTAADRALDEESEYMSYEYIGRYNLNLDKGSNEYYGFEIKGEHPYVTVDENHFSNAIADVAECWELRDNQGTWTSFKYPDAAAREDGFGDQTSAGTLEVAKHFEYRYNSEGDAIEVAMDDTVDASLTEVKGSGRTIDLSTQAKKNAYIREKFYNLERLFNWLDSTDTSVVPATDTGTPLPEPATYNTTVYYMVQSFKEGNADVAYYVDVDGNQLVKVNLVRDVDERHYYVYNVEEDGETVNIMERAIAPDDYTGTKRAKDDILVTYQTDCADYRLKKFVAEFNQHLDLEYCLVYFILTELLLCYDSRGKNLMIATWGPQTAGGDYIWFPIFYDIDTQLGLNNIGAVLWDYDTDATADGTFSTANSVLWQNFFKGFRTAIETKYRTLRAGSRLTETTIEGAYLCDPKVFTTSYAMKGVRPVIALGLDEWYKYIACGVNKSASWERGTDRRFGFYVSSYDAGRTKTTDASYVYTCQGDRKLSRELFIRNRLNFIDSWWLAGAYNKDTSTYKNEIMIRANANDTSTSDTYLDQSRVASDVAGYTRTAYPKEFYDATPQFTITPFLSQYVTVFYDEDPLTPTIKFNGLTPVLTHTTPSVENGYRAIAPYNEQLTYIPGGDFLSDIGDLSLKYPSHFKLTTGKRLTQLLIGGDAPGYTNGIIGKESGTFDLNDSASGTSKKGLLQKIVLTGLTVLNQAQDVSGSEKLREFRALRTAIPYVTFAKGAPLDTVHLPKTVDNLNLTYALNMKKMLTSPPEVMISDGNGGYVYNNRDNYEGLYIEGLTDWVIGSGTENQASSLNTLVLSNTALGYNSYKLLANAVDIRDRFRPTGYFGFSFENVEWSPYVAIEADVDYDENTTFYRLTDHNNFVVYQHTSAAEWEKLKINKKIFLYDQTQDSDLITDLDIIDEIIEDFNRATSVANNHYSNAIRGESPTRPGLTGTMFVNNDEQHPIAEIALQNVYKAFFPDLNIYAKYITEAYLAKFVQLQTGNREEVIDLIRYDVLEDEIVYASMTRITPGRTNYDFIGWTLNPDYVEVQKSDIDRLKGQGIILSEDAINAIPFSQDQKEYTFYAVFSITSFRIHFMDPQNTTQEYTSYLAPFGSALYEPEDYFVTNEQNISETERYKFIGWSKEVDSTTNNLYQDSSSANKAKKVDLTSIISQNGDQYFYAIYQKEDCLTNATDSKYFQFAWVAQGFEDRVDSSKNIGNSYFISIAQDINLKGKITLPATYNDGTHGELPVVGINTRGFMGVNTSTGEMGPGGYITHIYWLGDTSNFREIRMQAFQQRNSSSLLKYFQMPTGIRRIGLNAFTYASELEWIDFSRTEIQEIGASAFLGAFKAEDPNPRLCFPPTLTTIGASAFVSNFLNAREVFQSEVILEFGNANGAEGYSKLTSVGSDAFSMTDYTKVGTIYGYFATQQAAMAFANNIINNCRTLRGIGGEPTDYSTVNFQLTYPQ